MEPSNRAADADRARVIARLESEVATGRLTLEEFSDRAAAAYRARTIGDLAALTKDLPAPAVGGTGVGERHLLVPVLIAAAVAVAVIIIAVVVVVMMLGANSMMGPMGPMMGR